VFSLFDRYILKEIAPPFFLGVLVYTFVLLMNQILVLSELLIARGVPLRGVVELLVFLIPSVLAFTVPMAVLMGILAGLSRLSSDAEITAFKTLGIGQGRLLRPVLLFSLLGFLLTSFLAMYLAPRANHKWVMALSRSVLANVQFHIRPREFNESIPNAMIFVQDISPRSGWENLFVYFSSPPEEPKVILARSGKLHVYAAEKRASLELSRGMLHSYPVKDPETYRVTSFSRLEEELEVQGFFTNVSAEKRVREKDIGELWEGRLRIKEDLETFAPDKRETPAFRNKKQELVSHEIEIHKKMALPFSCFIFAILGLPLGAYTRKGGRTSGFTLSIGIILVYYILITAGEQFAMEGRISPLAGMWGPNLVFLVVGVVVFLRSLRESPLLSFSRLFRGKWRETGTMKRPLSTAGSFRLSLPFPNILDRYILRRYALIFGIVFVSLVSVYGIVTFFERIDSLYENHKPLRLLLTFIWFKIPEFVHYALPVSALAATLISLGLLTKSNEITAMKACGISLYRIIITPIVLAFLVSFASYYIQEKTLPYSNRKAEEIWNAINDVPPRSTSRLDRRWVLSRAKNRIYHYMYFDPLASVFSRLTVYEIDPAAWSLQRILFSEKGKLERGTLVLSDGWVREFAGPRVVRFVREESLILDKVEDKSYFLKEWKEPDQMSHAELRRYIGDIEAQGFETVRFKVDLHFKIAFPLASLIMTLLAIPFAFWMGKRGTLVGVGLSVAIAMVYWAAIAVFKSLGHVDYLSPFLAAWAPDFLFASLGLYLLSTMRT